MAAKTNQLNIPIDEYSSPILTSASVDTPITDVVELMKNEKIRHIPILKDNKPVGIISNRDLSLFDLITDKTDCVAGDVMRDNPFTVVKGTSIEDVAFEMSQRKIGSAIVVNPDGEIDSIFTSTDGLNALIEVVRGEIVGDE
jgi:CBS domain-containing protein